MLSHIRNRLTAQSTRALLCLGCWSLAGLVRDQDVRAIVSEEDIEGEDEEMPEGWDAIDTA